MNPDEPDMKTPEEAFAMFVDEVGTEMLTDSACRDYDAVVDATQKLMLSHRYFNGEILVSKDALADVRQAMDELATSIAHLSIALQMAEDAYAKV